MKTLSELLPEFRRLGSREAMRWVRPYRTETVTYEQLYGRIGACASFLDSQGLGRGSRLMIWAENRPEWAALFWACVARGVQVVPVDFRFSEDLAARIRKESGARLIADDAVLDSIAARAPASDFSIIRSDPDDIVEILYTSGTTGEPKGIVHRHRHLCANLEPFEREIQRYRKWARPFQPIRILDLLPLSHMFGQSMGLFIPVFLEGAVAFTSELHPGVILRATRANRISVIAAAPRVLEVLQQEVRRQFRLPPPPRARGIAGVAARWWKYRRVHSGLGWKFWAFVVGGARLDPQLEEFWSNLGFAVIQGYGLTEASPVVAVNHPLSAKRGSLGTPVPGQEVRIAPDGEILVRGASIAGAADDEGWLHTGDLGELDAEGRLYFRGRKKDMIVTSEGLNVIPEDVEAVLNRLPGVRDSAVVSIDDQVHAAFILQDPNARAEDIEPLVKEANERLETHQRIRRWSVWPNSDFPRTASTLKVRRGEVAEIIRKGPPEATWTPPPDPAGMSSLERVELLAELEARHGIEIDEEAFSRATTVEDLKRFASRPVEAQAIAEVSHWPMTFPARLFRRIFQRAVAAPLFQRYLPLTATGLENLASVAPPVIFAANHTSHLDTPAVFTALPPFWRARIAPAMGTEHFRPMFEPSRFPANQVWNCRFQYMLARLLYNAYPLPQDAAGVRRALAYTADLVQRGYCPLVFPEGRRSPDGRLERFRPGVGMMAVRLNVPVVPLYIDGLFDVFPTGRSWPTRGPVHVAIGPPLTFADDHRYEDAARALEEAVARLRASNCELRI